jgi:hypothetical protein
MLEPYAVKVARTVLKGLGVGNDPWLLDYMLPEKPGSDPARVNDGIEGRGFSKKRMSICNRSNRDSKFVLTRNGADLLSGVSLYARRQTCECE